MQTMLCEVVAVGKLASAITFNNDRKIGNTAVALVAFSFVCLFGCVVWWIGLFACLEDLVTTTLHFVRYHNSAFALSWKQSGIVMELFWNGIELRIIINGIIY